MSDDTGVGPAPVNDGTGLHARTYELFETFKSSDGPESRAARDALVELHLPLAEYLARRFSNRGEPHDDLVQVATVGLLNAVDRFDPERGLAFSTFATPTILGELKRHFRDRGWTIRVPRRLQEMQQSLSSAVATLTQELGRSPRMDEIARSIGVSVEEVIEGLEAASAYSPVSLDAPDSGGGSDGGDVAGLVDRLGSEDAALEAVLDREAVKPLLEALDPRAKRILMLRFFGNQTQSQIAAELGISQMHVSRLLSRTLAELRSGLEGHGGL